MKPYVLRRPSTNDMDASLAIHTDPRTNAYRPGGPPSEADVRTYLPTWLAHWDEHGFGYWTVTHHETGDVVGFGGVMLTTVGSHHGLNLYFRLSPTVWGQGLSTTIGRAALHEAFEVRDFERVLGLVRPANTPSRRALERTGLTEIETYADVPGEAPSLIYAITRSAYQARRP